MKRIPVIILGAGGVGQALMQQLVAGRARIAERCQCRFEVVAVADSASWLWHRDGLSDEQLLGIIEAKKRGDSVASTLKTADGEEVRPSAMKILDEAREEGLQRVIVVDVTAADGMDQVLDHALALGFTVAMANKKALAGPWVSSRKYFNHPRIRHESTVGGGQPVIATLRYLLDANDPIYQIEGQLSGTLGFICGRLDNGVPFSKAIAEAKQLGYTEPDPREDLGGKDVMRKVMILGRMAGWPLEEEDIQVESLFPPEMASLSIDEFMNVTPELNAEMWQRKEVAAAQGKVLRYVAQLGSQGGTVGLEALPARSPLANLKYISFRTAYYDDDPLLIGGKGAGVQMTAAGVMGDMISLVRELGSV
jgi:homoserine dehydrogenase